MSNTNILSRLQGVRDALTEQKIDGLLVTDITNLGYVSGFTGSTAFVLVTPDEALLLTDSRYTIRAHRECPGFEVLEAAGSGGYQDKLKEMLDARPALQRLGFEAGRVTVAQREQFGKNVGPNLEWVSTEGIVESLRAIKDAEEVAAIRQAIEIAESAFVSIKALMRPGVTEREIGLELEFAMRRAGADDCAFPSIVASGVQGAHPHHTPNQRPLVAGDLVTIDWGASVGGYNSDITRTIGISHLSQEQRDVYAVVLEAQQKAIAAIAPGRTGQEIDAVARDHIAAHGYGENFGHGLGHGLGRQVHDGPGFSTRSTNVVLKPGMVLTVEPGIYRENWGGIRIEEDVLVTEEGCEVLTHLPNALEVLG
jgi:Xaa-Pro aminopeptidase